MNRGLRGSMSRTHLLRCHSPTTVFRRLKNATRIVNCRKDTTSRHMSSAKISNDAQDYRTNGGTVEGVWLFHRHGDRVPCRQLMLYSMDEEEAFWRTRLPSSISEQEYYFPVRVHRSDMQEYQDIHKSPFGYLTQVGVYQMTQTGRHLNRRYRAYGYQSSNHDIKESRSLLEYWDFHALSTNYLRTVSSAQSLLNGMLRLEDNCEAGSDISSPNDPMVPIHVRDRSTDTLNAFDRNPDHMMNLVSQVVASKEFQQRDAKAAQLAQQLAEFLPGLIKRRGVFGGPSGINWVDATDHFVCRKSHAVEFTRFSPHEGSEEKESLLASLAHPTKKHLAWRFQQWHGHPELLGATAAPPLREVASVVQTTPFLGEGERRPFWIYSCHDVTILSLLYGMGAKVLLDPDFWPKYATTLVFELVRVNQVADNEEDAYVVRILLNDTPVSLCMEGSGPNGMLRISEFLKIVTDLEQNTGWPGLEEMAKQEQASRGEEASISLNDVI